MTSHGSSNIMRPNITKNPAATNVAIKHFTRTCLDDLTNRVDGGPSTASQIEDKGKSPMIDGISKRRLPTSWTPEEDDLLRKAVVRHRGKNWRLIAAELSNRTDVQCLHRWQKVLNPVLVKGYWTREEDERMIELVNMFGTKRWAAIARSLPGRNGKQCRERWCNHLDPSIRKDPWTEAEDLMLFLAHEKYGNKWAEIAKLLPGRSDNAVKNRWNTKVKKKAKFLEQYSILWSLQNAPPLGPDQGSPEDSSSLMDTMKAFEDQQAEADVHAAEVLLNSEVNMSVSVHSKFTGFQLF